MALLDATRVHLPADEYFLTAALPASQSILQCIDIRTAAHYLDMVNLMAYDFYGSWTHRSGHHSQLYAMNKDEPSGTSGIAFLIGAGCPAKKINLGIPLYGRSFLGVSGPGHRFKAVGGEDGTFDYNQLPRKGAKEQVDKRIGAAMCVGGDGSFVTYDNPDTVKMKATYCKQKGLGVSIYPTIFLFLGRDKILFSTSTEHVADHMNPGVVLLERALRCTGDIPKPRCDWFQNTA